MTTHVSVSDDPVDAELRFIDWLAELEHPLAATRRYAEQYHFFSLHQIRAFSQILLRFPATDRGAASLIASVLFDELGRGKANDVHSVMFERFARSIDVDVSALPLEPQNVIPGVRSYVDELFAAFDGTSTIPRAVATYLFLEESAVKTYAPFLAVLRGPRFAGADIEFFELHAELEVEHAQAAADLVDRYVGPDGPDRLAFADQQARMSRLWQAFWQDMRRHCADV